MRFSSWKRCIGANIEWRRTAWGCPRELETRTEHLLYTPVHGLKNAIAGKAGRDLHGRWVEVQELSDGCRII